MSNGKEEKEMKKEIMVNSIFNESRKEMALKKEKTFLVRRK